MIGDLSKRVAISKDPNAKWKHTGSMPKEGHFLAAVNRSQLYFGVKKYMYVLTEIRGN